MSQNWHTVCFSKVFKSFTDTATPICLYIVYGEWSMVVSTLQLQSWVVVTETVCSAELKIFNI